MKGRSQRCERPLFFVRDIFCSSNEGNRVTILFFYFCFREDIANMKKESDYQIELKKKIEKILPGCIVLKNDSNWIQGIPDLSVLYRGKYAILEVKRSAKAKHRPNQDYYIDKESEYTCARFIYPENEKEVLDELQRTLGS